MRRKILIASLTIGLFGLLPLACAGDPNELQDHHPSPPGTGGFDPGDGGYTSGSSSGSGIVSTGAGGAGGVDAGPPVCDDELKRCQHTFTYQDATAMTVQVLGSFNNWDTNAPPMAKNGNTFTTTATLPWQGEVLYKFRIVDTDTWIADPSNPDQVDDGFGGKNSRILDLMCADYTCDDPTLPGTFDWRDAVLYFVFVDRFVDGNPNNNGMTPAGVLPPAAYQGGDYAGLLQKINAGYFNDLGVNALWLTVPMDNPNATGMGSDGKLYTGYHGYWPSDLEASEEHFGTLAELQAVVDAAHMKGIKVILDYAMNHVHISAPIYAQHNDWFWPLNVNGKTCVCGDGCAWDGAEGKQCWFRDYLPDFNFTNAEARKYSIDNAIKWIQDTNVDGFRLDAVKHIDDAWIADLRLRLASDIESVSMQHFYTVGETFTGDRAAIKYYVDPDKKLTGQFDFPLRMNLAASILMRKIPMSDLANFLGSNDSYYGAGIMSTFIGNHDIPRAIHLAEDVPVWNDEWTDGKNKAWAPNTPGLPVGTSAFERMANAFTVLFTSKGVPLIYYGDEVGLPGGGDPDNRRMMQWGGYSSGQNLLLAHIKKLGKIRADHAALRRGKRTVLSVTLETLAYQMTKDADTVLVLVNRSDSAQSIAGIPGSSFTDLLNGGTHTGPSVMVPARSSLILTPK